MTAKPTIFSNFLDERPPIFFKNRTLFSICIKHITGFCKCFAIHWIMFKINTATKAVTSFNR